MTNKLLVEKSEVAKLTLEKIGLPNPPPLRVCLSIDVSGSMQTMFRDGSVQSAFDQLLGAALRLDDNGEIDTWVFDHSSKKIATAGPKDFSTFVHDKVLTNGHLWGGTSYAPAFQDILDEMFPSNSKVTRQAPMPAEKKGGFLSGIFGSKPAETPAPLRTITGPLGPPALAFFMTDGDSTNEGQAEDILAHSHDLPIYWNMVGVGRGSSFRFLKAMADKYDHVGFVDIPNIKITDTDMYAKLFTSEFTGWVKAL